MNSESSYRGSRPGTLLRLLAALSAAGVPAFLAAQGDAGAPDERFGVMTHFAQGWNPDWAPLVRAAGIGQVRDELYWKEVEPQKGVFRFPAAYDAYLGALRGAGISPLIVLSFENPSYDGGLTPYTREGIDAYARYAVEVLRHCGAQVKAVEVWNEYNGTFNHGPAGDNRAGTYLEMLRATYAAIKRERPDVIVVGGSTSGIPRPYWEKLMAGGALASMDALSVHPYRYDSAPEGIEDEISGLQDMVKKHNGGRAMPIWVTEIGWYTKASKAPGDLLIDERVQAEFLVRAYALLLSADVKRVYWYLLRDYQGLTMGLMHDDAQRTRKPAYRALATMVGQIRGARFERREETPGDLYSLLFRRASGEEVRILWSLVPRVLVLPFGAMAVDMEGGSLGSGGSLPLGQAPVYVTGPAPNLPNPLSGGAVIADSTRDFGDAPANGWSYGFFIGASRAFEPLTAFQTTDWKASWTGDFPSLAISADDQHPSNSGAEPVAAVRRWTSFLAGKVRVAGKFRCGTQGDGVGVSILVDGAPVFRVIIGGGAAIEKAFDFVTTVRPGTTVDFAVDPGAAANIDFDATRVGAIIRPAP